MPHQALLFEPESAVQPIRKTHNTHHDRTGKFTTKAQAEKEQVNRQLEGKQKHIDYLTNLVKYSGIQNRQLMEENKKLREQLNKQQPKN